MSWLRDRGEKLVADESGKKLIQAMQSLAADMVADVSCFCLAAMPSIEQRDCPLSRWGFSPRPLSVWVQSYCLVLRSCLQTCVHIN